MALWLAVFLIFSNEQQPAELCNICHAISRSRVARGEISEVDDLPNQFPVDFKLRSFKPIVSPPRSRASWTASGFTRRYYHCFSFKFSSSFYYLIRRSFSTRRAIMQSGVNSKYCLRLSMLSPYCRSFSFAVVRITRHGSS